MADEKETNVTEEKEMEKDMELTKQEMEDYIISEEKDGRLYTYYELESHFGMGRGGHKTIRPVFLDILKELNEEGKLSDAVIEKMFIQGKYPIEAKPYIEKKSTED